MLKSEVTGREIRGDQSAETRPLVVSIAKARVLLDCGHDQIYDLIKAGELDSYTESNRRKIVMASIEALVAKRSAATGGEYRRGPQVPPLPKKKAEASKDAA
ncbi:MAG: hypothetical protein WAK04_09835 [Xanthobacteraceae bacterium]